MTRFTAMALAAALALGATSAASAATVLQAGWSDSCGKGSNCFSDKGVYQQSFAASGFTGPVTVGQLLLDRSILGDLDGKTFRLSFTLNGEELGTWGQFTMGGIGGDELGFDGADFIWNPEDGDLVLVLEILQPRKEGGFLGSAFTAMALEGSGNILPDTGGPGDPDEPGDPNDPRIPVSGAPEPSSWALMIIGFGGAGALLRRRRATQAALPA